MGLGYLGKTPVVDLVAGSAAGATAVAFTYPLDLLRTRLAWRTSAVVASSSGGRHHHHRATMASVLAQLARKEGIPGLYKGVSPTLLGIFPYAGLKFFVYQYLKGVYMEGGRAKEADASPPPAPPRLKRSWVNAAKLSALEKSLTAATPTRFTRSC